MLVKRDALDDALSIVLMVPPQSGLLCSQYIRFAKEGAKLRLQLTGIATSEVWIGGGDLVKVTGDVPEGHFDRRLLKAFVDAHPRASTISLISKDKRLLLRCGTQVLEVDCAEHVSGYGSRSPSGKRLRRMELSDELGDVLRLLGQYASNTAVADHLNVIRLVRGYGAFATDSFSMAAVLDPEFPLDGFFPPILPRLVRGNVSVEMEQSGTSVMFERGYIYQPVSESCRTKFPERNLRRLLDDLLKSEPSFELPTKIFREIVGAFNKFLFGGANAQRSAVRAVGAASKRSVLFELPLVQGKAARRVKTDLREDFSKAWPASTIVPWVEALPESAEKVEFYAKDFGVGFIARASGKTLALIVAEVRT